MLAPTICRSPFRTILADPETDSAVILLQPNVLELPDELIPLLLSDKFLKIGVEIGWVGFPAMEPYTICFFSGNISARQSHRHAYLFDRVAINGVSRGSTSTAANRFKLIHYSTTRRGGFSFAPTRRDSIRRGWQPRARSRTIPAKLLPAATPPWPHPGTPFHPSA